MKKSLFVVIMISLSLMFAFSAVAQDEPDITVSCEACSGKECVLPNIPCPPEAQQGGTPAVCPPTQVLWNCFYFPICDCPDRNEYFAAGKKVGIRMYIETEGVFFAENETEIGFRVYNDETDACTVDYIDGTNIIDPNVGANFDYLGGANGSEFSGIFTDVVYYEEEGCAIGNEIDPDNTNACRGLTNRPRTMSTNTVNPDAFFTIPAGWEGYSYWSVEIPDLKIDINSIVEDTVRIRVVFIIPGEGGICTDRCLEVCECEITVATLCGTSGGGATGCIYFPYVYQQGAELNTPWITGIAITNVGMVSAADMTAKFTLTDSAGNVFTYDKTDFTGPMFVTVLDALVNQNLFVGGTPAPGAAWLRVDANFPIDGYQFMTDTVFGGSTLGRQTCP